EVVRDAGPLLFAPGARRHGNHPSRPCQRGRPPGFSPHAAGSDIHVSTTACHASNVAPVYCNIRPHLPVRHRTRYVRYTPAFPRVLRIPRVSFPLISHYPRGAPTRLEFSVMRSVPTRIVVIVCA